MDSDDQFTPIFALGTVLFPGGRLPLRVFETRYLDMIRDALKADRPFGVCLIRAGREVGQAAQVHETGTLARIVDWQRLPDGLLGVIALGEARFRATGFRVLANQLLTARVEGTLAEPPVPVPPDLAGLADLYRALGDTGSLAEPPADAGILAYRLAERLPLDPPRRQALLETDDPVARLRRLRDMLPPATG